MVCEPRAQISKPGTEFMPPGAQYLNIEVRGTILGPPGAGFFNYDSPGGWTCQVMHSGSAGWLNFSIIFGLSDKFFCSSFSIE